MLKEDLGDIFFNYAEEFDVGSPEPSGTHPGMDSVPILHGFSVQGSHGKDLHETRFVQLRNTQLSRG